MNQRILVAIMVAAMFVAPAFARHKLSKTVGTAIIEQEKPGVAIHLTVSGLTPGEHAIHFHQKASCIAPDFKSAGGHFNPTGAHHGLRNPAGPHAGDMANFTVAADGTAKVTVKDERVTLEPGTPNSLYAEGGR
jgi:Cu-Zn family superoxide dismutase